LVWTCWLVACALLHLLHSPVSQLHLRCTCDSETLVTWAAMRSASRSKPSPGELTVSLAWRLTGGAFEGRTG